MTTPSAVPDVLAPGLDVVFCGINPGLHSDAKAAHFANPRNDFWRLLHAAGFTPRLVDPSEQFAVLAYGVGITNAAYRTTRGSSDLRRRDFAGSAERLERLALELSPRALAFVGKEAYRGPFGGRPEHGLQDRRLGETLLFVLPSTSPANAAVPWEERLRWFRELRALVPAAPPWQTPRMRVAALLRGINIGARKRVSMPALREIVASLGHTNVETYLQSGNVAFTPAPGAEDLAAGLEKAIEAATGLEVAVVVRSGDELRSVVEGNPYQVDDPTKVVVAFLGEAVELGDLSLGDLGSYLPDELTLAGRELYVSVPNGQARSKLMEALTKRRLPTTLTVRNWRTVLALAELCAEEEEGRG